MFFQLAQFSKFFLIAPITWMIAAFIAALFIKRKWLKISLLILSLLMFLVFTNPYLADYVKYRQTMKYAESTFNPHKNYKLAIVMGGFGSINSNTHTLIYDDDRADRLWEAVRLYKQGIVKRILITGDSTSKVRDDGTSTANEFLDYMEAFGVPANAFILEQHADNTKDNARLSKDIIDSLKIKDDDILLITSGIHMKRSLDTFERLDLHPDFYAVTLKNPPGSFKFRSLYPRWEAAVEWQEMFNEWIGELIYKL